MGQNHEQKEATLNWTQNQCYDKSYF